MNKKKPKKAQRSSKWSFLLYKDSVPEDYIYILNGLQIPYILSPWHDKDVDKKTGEIQKAHKHGVFYFETLKSFEQVSEIVSTHLNAPSMVQVVHSTKGIYDYFIHAQNPDKSQYNKEDIESGAGFNLDKFLQDTDNNNQYLITVIETIETLDFKEFSDLVDYARKNDYMLLELIFNKTFFFTKYLDSRRYRKVIEDLENPNKKMVTNASDQTNTDNQNN